MTADAGNYTRSDGGRPRANAAGLLAICAVRSALAVLLLAWLASFSTGCTSAPSTTTNPGRGFGANVADLKNARYLNEKSFLFWRRIEPEPGNHDWLDLDKALAVSKERSLKLLLRLDGAPVWAHLDNPSPTAPPDPKRLAAWGDFVEQVARRGKGRGAAYEIWNEPNLSWQWGDRSPDPAYYVELLRVAHERIKQADPQALVVSAGLAPTQGDGGQRALDNLEYLRAMYRAGAAPYFDVLGSHPYGFTTPPEADPAEHASFRSVEREQAIIEELGDGHKPVWATEMGWLIDPSSADHPECRATPGWDGVRGQTVSAERQAEYLVRAYRYAREHWPWMGVIFLFNLDFSLAPWYGPCEPMRYHAVLNAEGSPRPAFRALQELARESPRER